jgi:7,8-dihydropterin-6-yl-methyl-4-(beta-D-ribofuranosyl)aminobenzene 5'-phosphate synthase
MLIPIDSIEILAIVDNEVDPMSPPPAGITATGGIGMVAFTKGTDIGGERGGVKGGKGTDMMKELAMEQLCCGAHGLSLMLVCIFVISFSLRGVGDCSL